MKNIFVFLCLALLCGCHGFSAKKNSTEDSAQYYPPTPSRLDKNEFRHYYRLLSSFFDSLLLRSGFNGSILVAKDGNIVYEKYSGKIDLRKKDSITASTPLHIASVSKTFTAIAILQMVQKKELKLTDSLTTFFPGFPYRGITIKMLLDHRSGLPNYLYFISNSDWDKAKYVTNQDVLNFLYTEKPKMSFPPDTHFSYSNTNYVLLALIIEKISGETFPVYMQKIFFKPLGMKDTYIFTLADSLKATPSFNYNGRVWDRDFLEGTYGDKNVYTTPRDLLKWDQALYTEQLISKELLDSAFTPYSFERKSIHNYGLGWRLQLLPNGKKIIYHFGRWHGFNAAFSRLVEEKATIIILGNKFDRNIYYAARAAANIFGDYYPKPATDEDDTEEMVPEKNK
ncbi:MAG TPA: serine hydrolase domain-containing protein, partial [Chitinophagaceae bacterium]|nr:serine hydrolase domain-containing protein [Chitinophagaceae bacterium]